MTPGEPGSAGRQGPNKPIQRPMAKVSHWQYVETIYDTFPMPAVNVIARRIGEKC